MLDTLHAQAPQLALSTTEPFQMFEAPEAAPILQRLDFLLATCIRFSSRVSHRAGGQRG